MQERIKSYYEHYDEEGRLSRDRAHLPEYLTTIHYFDRLFRPGSRILDACAGAGRYSFYLADQGHSVTACDLVEHNINIIKSRPDADKLADIAVCDVLDLSHFAEGSFDIVLCMGALYHLDTDELRRHAVAECVRVCKPNGLVALAYINKVGSIMASIDAEASNMADQLRVWHGTGSNSIFLATTPQEIERIAAESGLTLLHNIGTDGLIYCVGSKLNAASEEHFREYMQYQLLSCEDQSIIGASLHGLWIGKKL